MKNLLKILPVTMILFSFSNCASGRKLQKEPPVEVKQAYYSTWTAEVRGADSGIAFFLPIEGNKNVILDSVYFRGRIEALHEEPETKGLYAAYFKIPSKEGLPDDFVMHSDPKKEFGNKPPVILKDFPFELKSDEAVIRYTVGDKVRYFKTNVIKKEDSLPIMRKKPENIRH